MERETKSITFYDRVLEISIETIGDMDGDITVTDVFIHGRFGVNRMNMEQFLQLATKMGMTPKDLIDAVPDGGISAPFTVKYCE